MSSARYKTSQPRYMHNFIAIVTPQSNDSTMKVTIALSTLICFPALVVPHTTHSYALKSFLYRLTNKMFVVGCCRGFAKNIYTFNTVIFWKFDTPRKGVQHFCNSLCGFQ